MACLDLLSDRQRGMKAGGGSLVVTRASAVHPSEPPVPAFSPHVCVLNPGVRVNEKGVDHRERRQSSPRHLCSPLAHRDPLCVTGPPLLNPLPMSALCPLGCDVSSGCSVACKHNSPSMVLHKNNRLKSMEVISIILRTPSA